MFRPNVSFEYSRVTGHNTFGKRSYGSWVTSRCGIIYLVESADPTSVRTDSSASRSNAVDENIRARILVPHSLKLTQGDRVRVAGFTMTVQGVFPRYAVNGNHDHWQVDLEVSKN